jgi:serine/threonine protein phosphatase PrpC
MKICCSFSSVYSSTHSAILWVMLICMILAQVQGAFAVMAPAVNLSWKTDLIQDQPIHVAEVICCPLFFMGLKGSTGYISTLSNGSAALDASICPGTTLINAFPTNFARELYVDRKLINDEQYRNCRVPAYYSNWNEWADLSSSANPCPESMVPTRGVNTAGNTDIFQKVCDCLSTGLIVAIAILALAFRWSHPRIRIAAKVEQAHPAQPAIATGPCMVMGLNPSAIPDPDVEMQRLINEAFRRSDLSIKPCRPDPLAMAIATDKGPVRLTNQDYCLGFTMGNRQIFLCADGCGGPPHGELASYVAIISAAQFLVEKLGCPDGTAPEMLPLMAIRYACHALTAFARVSTPPIESGLRTTLIVIIAEPKRYCVAYAGDGGGIVVRKSGQIERFLFPQKAFDGIDNVLAVSLGPVLEGEPALGIIPRYPGDVLMCGSDGVFDRANDEFPRFVVDTITQSDSNVMLTVRQLLAELNAAIDTHGPICNDNLTLGLLVTPVTNFHETVTTQEGDISTSRGTTPGITQEEVCHA